MTGRLLARPRAGQAFTTSWARAPSTLNFAFGVVEGTQDELTVSVIPGRGNGRTPGNPGVLIGSRSGA